MADDIKIPPEEIREAGAEYGQMALYEVPEEPIEKKTPTEEFAEEFIEKSLLLIGTRSQAKPEIKALASMLAENDTRAGQKNLASMQNMLNALTRGENGQGNNITGLSAQMQSAVENVVLQVSRMLKENREEFEAIFALAEYWGRLKECLQAEIDKTNAEHPEAEPITIEAVMTLMEINGEPVTKVNGKHIKNPYIELIRRAQKTLKAPLVQIKPTAHTMPNNALMNALQQKPIINNEGGAFDLVVANAKGKRKEITAFTMIEHDPGQTGIKITNGHLSEYERQVSDAIISIWLEAAKEGVPPIFTPDMVYGVMPGGSGTASPQQKEAITKTIEKFRRLHISVDATEEMRRRGVIGEDETFKLGDFYLNARDAEYKVKNGGQTVKAYQIKEEPIVLTYCTPTKQLLTVPAKYLAIKKIKKGRVSDELVTMTADRQAMTGYMLRRIAVMKHDRKNKVQTQSNVILFDTLFSETETKTDDRKQTMLNRNFCFDVLDYWKAAGFIKGYSRQEKGRSITGITIEF